MIPRLLFSLNLISRNKKYIFKALVNLVNSPWNSLQWSPLPGTDTCGVFSPSAGWVDLVTCFLPTEYDKSDGIEVPWWSNNTCNFCLALLSCPLSYPLSEESCHAVSCLRGEKLGEAYMAKTERSKPPETSAEPWGPQPKSPWENESFQ